MVRIDASRGLKVVLQAAAVAAAYFAAGRLGLLEQVVVAGARVTPLWPPTGIAVTALLLYGLRLWPGVAAGALLVIASIGSVDAGALAITAGNTLAPVCACLALRRAGFRPELDRLRDGVALVFLGALAGMLISATVGSTTLLVGGSLTGEEFWATWSAWWVGDAMGVLVVAPVLLAAHRFRLPGAELRPRWLEPAVLLAVTVVVGYVAARSPFDLLFLVFPLIVWAALRFELAGAAPCVLAASVLTITAATEDAGPFAGQSVLHQMVTLQALNGSAALTGLLLAAIVAERQNTHRKIQQACDELTEVVSRLASGGDPRRGAAGPEHRPYGTTPRPPGAAD
ncbi:MASE1 domain-containing protein [Kitasatospora sp. NPDC048540]|uniref:MASE1 domain-containing protein n=2 Tax=unclassified Kitasatospora TaxID=2633591 RepID=UPI0033E9004C